MSAEQNGSSGSDPSSKQKTCICPACGSGFNRPQDVERHFQSFHLPYWMFCPHENCKWRGSRMDDFERHLDAKQCGPKPKEQECQIYNAKLVTSWLKDSQGGGVVSMAKSYAVDLVKERATVLGRQDWLDDPWGISQGTQARRLRAA